MGETKKALLICVAAALLVALPPASAADFFSFSKSSFSSDDNSEFASRKDASISGHALQITPDSINNNFTLFNRSGRVSYFQPFRLWQGDRNSSAPGTLASFNSSFTVNIFRPSNNTAGEGLAFIIAPDMEAPVGSEGQWLGLTNATLDGKADNQLLAVELDTMKEDFDPDDNHIGLDINSVKSNVTFPLSSIGIELAPEIPVNYTVWVEYNGSSMLLSIFIAEEHKPKPAASVISKTINLKQIVKEESYFGFAASTGQTAQLNCVLKWNLTVEILPGDGNNAVRLAVAIGVPVVVLVLIAGSVAGYLVYRKKMIDDSKLVGALKSLPGTPREFRFGDLKKATNNFDEKMKLGQGGFGIVYKGVLGKQQHEVAVKKFSRENLKGKNDFLAELTIINRLRHRHLVKLVGWCHKNGVLLLVYDYMPNGSLDRHLFAAPPENEKVLNWERRYNILAGVASALNYLHHEYDQTVVHRDLKASNIMLDSDFNARLGDFGLARALENEVTSYTEQEGVPGTMGYIAPECFHTGRATRESDVFAFGAVILEVVCGLRPRVNIEAFHFLVDWVWTLHREGRILDAVDDRLADDYAAEDAQRLLLLGLACSHPIAAERPKTPAVLQVISRSVPPPGVPPFKPAFVWPMVWPAGDDNSSIISNDTTPITSSYYGSGWTPRFLSRDSANGHSMA